MEAALPHDSSATVCPSRRWRQGANHPACRSFAGCSREADFKLKRSGIAAGVRLFGIVDVRDLDRQLDTARASSAADPGLALADDDNSRRAIAREPDLGSWRHRLQRRVAPEADKAPYARGGRIAVASTSIR